MDQFKKVAKIFLPQKIINVFYHLPKAVLANFLYGFPSKNLKVIGVTGTDGKTTTVNMIYQVLKEAGYRVSMVSTVNAEIAGRVVDTGFHVTSPDPFSVQKFAKEAKGKGDKYLILEVTSHALDQYRFWGINFDLAVVTNITHEHLDYHKTWENYFLTKAKLIKGVKTVVLNRDEKHFAKMAKLTAGRIISFGLSKSAIFNPQIFPIKMKIFGTYNMLNAQATAAVASILGVSKEQITKTLAKFVLPDGRMEEIENNLGLRIFVDFGHTPNGIASALNALLELKPKRLISVIGAEGYRDEGKRPMMGKIAQELSDFVIVTEVDSRGLMDRINEQIKEGALKAGAEEGENFFIIKDRTAAIDFAINNLGSSGDIVGIFGKGHESSMNLDGQKEVPWSDYLAVDQALTHGRKN